MYWKSLILIGMVVIICLFHKLSRLIPEYPGLTCDVSSTMNTVFHAGLISAERAASSVVKKELKNVKANFTLE
jgi:hypothetical protein